MISVIIPTLDAADGLTRTLAALVPGALEGLIREVVIVDGGSRDETEGIADAAGAHFIESQRGRGLQLAAGARASTGSWLLFLHADTVLEAGWIEDAAKFIEQVETGRRREGAAAFRFALDDFGFRPRLLEKLVAVRCAIFHMAYGDQGLLIPRRLYEEIGGYRQIPLMEDVAMARALGRRRTVVLPSRAVTSAKRFKREGYFARSARNVSCLLLYYLRVPPRLLVRWYG